MHARKLGFTVLLSSIAALQLGGCRGLNPTTDLIQVTQDQNAEVATIESVAQRLNSPANESTKDPGTIDPIQQRLAAQAERVKRRREELMSANRAPNPNAKKVAKTSDKKSAPVSMSISDAFATISSETTKPKAETAKADSPKPAVASSPAPAATEKNDMHITLTDDMFTDDKPPVATPAFKNRPPFKTTKKPAQAENQLVATEPPTPTVTKTIATQPSETPAKPAAVAAAAEPIVAENKDEEVAIGKSTNAGALSSIPADIREEVMARLAKSLANGADRTGQPNPMASQLAKALKSLPTLPPKTSQVPSVVPQRLAQNNPGVSTQTNPKPQQEPLQQKAAPPVQVADLKAPPLQLPTEVASNLSTATKELDSLMANRQQQPASIPALELPDSVAPIASAVPAKQNPPLAQATATLPTTDAPEAANVAQAVAVVPFASPQNEPPMPAIALSLPAPPSLPQEPVQQASASAPLEMAQANEQADDLKTDPAFASNAELYEVLIARLTNPGLAESESEKNRRLIMLQYLMVLSGKTAGSNQLQELSEQERKYLEFQLNGLRKVIDPKAHPSMGRRLSAALPELREANKYLAAASDELDVRNLLFCTEIEAFGQVKAFPGNRFHSGQQVILYCEVDNFVANKTDKGYQTKLKGSFEIFDASNNKVNSQSLPTDVQLASTYIRDYFIAYQMNLPSDLTVGTYRLKLTMEDAHGKKYGQASIPFEITAKPAE